MNSVGTEKKVEAVRERTDEHGTVADCLEAVLVDLGRGRRVERLVPVGDPLHRPEGALKVGFVSRPVTHIASERVDFSSEALQ